MALTQLLRLVPGSLGLAVGTLSSQDAATLAAATALLACAVKDASGAQRLAAEGAIPALVLLLQRSPHLEAGTLRSAAACLAHLAACDAHACRRMAEAGLLEIAQDSTACALCAAMGSADADTAAAAASIAHGLCDLDSDMRQLAVAGGIVASLVDLLQAADGPGQMMAAATAAAALLLLCEDGRFGDVLTNQGGWQRV